MRGPGKASIFSSIINVPNMPDGQNVEGEFLVTLRLVFQSKSYMQITQVSLVILSSSEEVEGADVAVECEQEQGQCFLTHDFQMHFLGHFEKVLPKFHLLTF